MFLIWRARQKKTTSGLSALSPLINLDPSIHSHSLLFLWRDPVRNLKEALLAMSVGDHSTERAPGASPPSLAAAPGRCPETDPEAAPEDE